MKRLIWVGKSYEDLREFPPDVRHAMGYALYAAQIGKMHEHAKVLSGMGNAKVIEIGENDRRGTYRIIYTIEMKDFIFVLHAFQKKSTRGTKTPQREIDTISSRLEAAADDYRRRYGARKRKKGNN